MYGMIYTICAYALQLHPPPGASVESPTTPQRVLIIGSSAAVSHSAASFISHSAASSQSLSAAISHFPAVAHSHEKAEWPGAEQEAGGGQCCSVFQSQATPMLCDVLSPENLMLGSGIYEWDAANNSPNAMTPAQVCPHWNTGQHSAAQCNAVQHNAPHCNTVRHSAAHCNTLYHTAMPCNALQHAATHCNALQRNAKHCQGTFAGLF